MSFADGGFFSAAPKRNPPRRVLDKRAAGISLPPRRMTQQAGTRANRPPLPEIGGAVVKNDEIAEVLVLPRHERPPGRIPRCVPLEGVGDGGERDLGAHPLQTRFGQDPVLLRLEPGLVRRSLVS